MISFVLLFPSISLLISVPLSLLSLIPPSICIIRFLPYSYSRLFLFLYFILSLIFLFLLVLFHFIYQLPLGIIAFFFFSLPTQLSFLFVSLYLSFFPSLLPSLSIKLILLTFSFPFSLFHMQGRSNTLT